MFRSFALTFFPFAIEKKGLCDPTLPFVKTIGPEEYKGEILIMLVSKVTVAVVAPGFKDKTRYTLYVSPGSQISHIATNKGDIMRQYLLHNVLVKGK